MKSLKQIREASGGKEAYQKFFNSLLKKFGVSSPAELEGDQKKKFYDELDAGWEGDNEKPETNEKMNQDNMDPETMNQADPDEEEINAAYMKAHKMNGVEPSFAILARRICWRLCFNEPCFACAWLQLM